MSHHVSSPCQEQICTIQPFTIILALDYTCSCTVERFSILTIAIIMMYYHQVNDGCQSDLYISKTPNCIC